MKRDFSKRSIKDFADKVDRKASMSGSSKKETSSKKRLSIYDDFDDEEDFFDPKYKSSRLKR